MTFVYSQKSENQLSTCSLKLQSVFREVLKTYDHSIIIGHRTEEEQAREFAEGSSTLSWPASKHNATPSLAVDAAPWPIDWDDMERFKAFGGFVMGVATMMGVNLRWGCDWDGDWNFKDQSFVDAPHFELIL